MNFDGTEETAQQVVNNEHMEIDTANPSAESMEMNEEEYGIFRSQVRTFKYLLKQIAEIHRTEKESSSVPYKAGSSVSMDAQSETILPKQKITDPATTKVVKKEIRPVKVKPIENTAPKDPPALVKEQVPVKAVQAFPPVVEKKSTPTLSWQCFNALMFTGPAKLPEGTISMTSANVSMFSKATHIPLTLTAPYAATVREKMIRRLISCDEKSSTGLSDEQKLFVLQRKTRASLVKDFVDCCDGDVHPPQSNLSNLLSRHIYTRTKKQPKKDVKFWEKDLKKRKAEAEDSLRRKQQDFFRMLMGHKDEIGHRDEFIRFHKAKRSEAAKMARLVKAFIDSQDTQREKDEARMEKERIQALKENNMEAYAKMIQDTKNTRLKFLLNQTDSYITQINDLIQVQREESLDGTPIVVSDNNAVTMDLIKSADSSPSRTELQRQQSADSNTSSSSTNYYDSAHRKVEKVVQPSMLKGGDLKEYQVAGLQWMVSLYNNNLNGILADDMGLGKTVQTIALLSYLMEFKNNKGPFLIVVPLSTLSNWVNECARWAPEMVKVVYKGTPEIRKQIFRDEVERGEFNVLLTTYEYTMKDKGQLKKLFWQYIIVDEGHRMKNAESKFAQTLSMTYQSRNRILLTGTPLQNNLPELWALLNFLLPTIFNSVDTFDEWFNKPFAKFRHQGKEKESAESTEQDMALNQEEQLLIVHRLHELLRPFMLRRVKDQVLDQLPEKVENVIRCELSGWQKQIYDTIHKKSVASKEGTGSAGFNNSMMQLRKICNHPYVFLHEWNIDEDIIRCSGKFELLDRMLPKLKAAGHRILLFSQMTQVMTILERFFEYRKYSFLRLDGSTSSEEREKRMFMFNDQDSPYFIFLLSTRAGGLGLNLATADTVIIFDSDWNPMMDAQAQDRAHRIGQRNEVRVFRLVTTSPIEERILARATDKKNLNSLAVEAGQFNKASRGANTEDRKEMMTNLLKEWSSGADVDIDAEMEDIEIPDDDQINEMMAIHSSDLEIYRRIDSERERIRFESWVQKHKAAGYVDSSIPPLPGRLMTADEAPAWINESSWNSKSMSTTLAKSSSADDMTLLAEEADGGKRKRKDVVYDDGLTDDQYCRALEKQADAEEMKQKRMKVEEQSAREAKKASALDAKPRGKALTQAIVKSLDKLLIDLQKMRREDQSLPSYYFKVKPDKSMYPDYYQIIKDPISFKEISTKLKKNLYCSINEFEADFALLCTNARTYNAPGTPVYLDSEYLRQAFYEQLCVICDQYDLPKFSNPISSSGIEPSLTVCIPSGGNPKISEAADTMSEDEDNEDMENNEDGMIEDAEAIEDGGSERGGALKISFSKSLYRGGDMMS